MSLNDITEQHEHELIYKRFMLSQMDGTYKSVAYVEADLTMDVVEKIGGNIFEDNEKFVGSKYSELITSQISWRFKDSDFQELENLLG